MKYFFVTLKYSVIMFLGFIVQWWLMELSPFNIPNYIPATPIPITGLFLVTIIVTVLIFAQKELLTRNSSFKIVSLTFFGAIIGLVATIEFLHLMSIYYAAPWSDYAIRLTKLSLYIAVVAFMVAFQIKTRKTGYLILLIFAFGMLIQLAYFLFPTLKR